MFFGPKKEITPWREVLFHRIYPAAARKGLKLYTLYLHCCLIYLAKNASSH
jgi:hypothetical protein